MLSYCGKKEDSQSENIVGQSEKKKMYQRLASRSAIKYLTKYVDALKEYEDLRRRRKIYI